ncbi:MAG: ABC transporter ATP-binding protein/permease [Bacteroidia bacterium]|nr:ABC transporter ATP-binding protein/permease [Bacteroidia bacterium]
MRSLIKLLFPFYRRHGGLFILGVVAVAGVNALALIPGWTAGKVIDFLTEVQHAQTMAAVLLPIAGYLGLLWGLSITRAFLMVAMRLTLVVVSRRVERDQRAALTAQLLEWDLTTLQKYPVGDLMTYFTEDLNRLRNFTGPVILYGLQVIFLVLFTASLMIAMHPKLALITLAPLLFIGPISYLLRKKALQRGHIQQEAFARLSAFIQQVYPYLRPLRAIANPIALSQEWNRRTDRHTQASLAVASVEGYIQPLMTLFIGLSLTLVIIYGGLAVLNGEITLGVVGAFSLYILQLMFPLGALGWLISLVQQARASAERLLSLQSIEPELRYPRVSIARPAHSGWSWENLGFYYEPRRWLFRHLNGSIHAGAKVALSMPMGSGKTTLARLLIRQLDPKEGQIGYGGVVLSSMSRTDLRRYIGYVPQQPVLLSGTIIENLRSVKPEASFSEIWKVLEIAGLAEEVSRLPKALHTEIGVWGQQVSGGQRQRLALAMVLLRSPQALVLDETFAPLDGDKVQEILTYLHKHYAGATWFIITHRQEVRPFVDVWLTDFQAISPKGSEIGAR